MENRKLILKALDYVKSEYKNSELTVDSVADHTGFNTDYFNRIFAAHTGFHIMEYARFLRLRQASLKLRTSDDSILDVALDCGYDSHESFSRAFKNQYGKTPSEFRESMKSVEPLYGEFHNETLGAQLSHEFPELKTANTDEVIDYLLEKDAIKNRSISITLHINGSIVLYKGETFSDGFFAASEINGKILIDIFSEDYKLITDYFKMFDNDRYSVTVYGDIDESLFKAELKKRKIIYKKTECTKEAIYLGERYRIESPANMVMRELGYEDYDIIEMFYLEKFGEIKRNVHVYLGHLKDELKSRDLNGCDHSTFLFGLFDGTHMIGHTLGCIQKVRGLGINNEIVSYFLANYDTEELRNYAFQFVTNAALDKGVLPVVTLPSDEEIAENNCVDPQKLGYEVIQKCWCIG